MAEGRFGWVKATPTSNLGRGEGELVAPRLAQALVGVGET
jgi:hypothetical protein